MRLVLTFVAALVLSIAHGATAPPVPTDWKGFLYSDFPGDRKSVAAIQKMELYSQCMAWGRAARSGKDQRWTSALLANLQHEKGVNDIDVGNITEVHPVIGMSLCGVVAIMGRPDRVNQTQSARGHHSQLVYRSRRTYVYLDGPTADGLVSAVQY
jgi:hypothetical protein